LHHAESYRETQDAAWLGYFPAFAKPVFLVRLLGDRTPFFGLNELQPDLIDLPRL
jgi:hypothetical protein